MPGSEDTAGTFTAEVRTASGRRLTLTLAETTPLDVRTKAVDLVPDDQDVATVAVSEGQAPNWAARTTNGGDTTSETDD